MLSVAANLRALAIAGWLLGGRAVVHGQQIASLTTLHSFAGSDGAGPSAGLIQGDDGNFYGTTYGGGAGDVTANIAGDGTIFQLTPAGALTTLYSFSGGDGANPEAGLAQDGDGNLYGTTYAGGAGGNGGIIFRLTPAGVLTTLDTLNAGDGRKPISGLTPGGDGNFYGTTSGGGGNDGTVFQLTPTGTLTVLHAFDSDDGSGPLTLVQGSDGNFYGCTNGGGEEFDGTIFQLTPAGNLTTLHTFGYNDGAGPSAGLVQGSDGNFYGTTTNGGDAYGAGTVFRISSGGDLTTLHVFGYSDGAHPKGGLVQGSDGNFYGTTSEGGDANGDGTVFEMTPAGVLTTLVFFNGNNGQGPQGNLVQGSDGSFYGVTYSGGSDDNGTVFKLTLTTPPPDFFSTEVPLDTGVYYLAFPTGNYFGYYSYLADPAYLYHFDLGYEYVFDAADGHSGIYLYDFASGGFFYTSPAFPFPYLYDFALQSVVYYYPDPSRAGHYNIDGVRYFYVFNTRETIPL